MRAHVKSSTCGPLLAPYSSNVPLCRVWERKGNKCWDAEALLDATTKSGSVWAKAQAHHCTTTSQPIMLQPHTSAQMWPVAVTDAFMDSDIQKFLYISTAFYSSCPCFKCVPGAWFVPPLLRHNSLVSKCVYVQISAGCDVFDLDALNK